MGARYLIDTNALSDYLGKRLPVTGMDFMDEVIDNAPTLSVMNRIELLGHNLPELPPVQDCGGWMHCSRPDRNDYSPNNCPA